MALQEKTKAGRDTQVTQHPTLMYYIIPNIKPNLSFSNLIHVNYQNNEKKELRE